MNGVTSLTGVTRAHADMAPLPSSGSGGIISRIRCTHSRPCASTNSQACPEGDPPVYLSPSIEGDSGRLRVYKGVSVFFGPVGGVTTQGVAGRLRS